MTDRLTPGREAEILERALASDVGALLAELDAVRRERDALRRELDGAMHALRSLPERDATRRLDRVREAWARLPPVSWEAGIYAEHGSGPEGSEALREAYAAITEIEAVLAGTALKEGT